MAGADELLRGGTPTLLHGLPPPQTHTRRRPPPRLPPQYNDLQQQLALVNDNPMLGLQEATELLATQLGADLAA